MSPDTGQSEEWFALQVRSNHERVVQASLQAKGYPDFLPQYRKRSRWSDRHKDIDVPLFPGYIFSRFPVHRRLPILTIPGVLRIVGAGPTPEPVSEAELNAIRSFVSSGLPLTPWAFLNIGDLVLIEYGPLAGIEGLLVQMKSQCRVVVSVSLLQRSVAAEVARDWIRPIRSAVLHRPVCHLAHS